MSMTISVNQIFQFQNSKNSKNQPATGEWWFAGGRSQREESINEALLREVKEEIGLEILSQRLINVY